MSTTKIGHVYQDLFIICLNTCHMIENSSLFISHDWRFLSIRQYGHVWALELSSSWYFRYKLSIRAVHWYKITPNPLSMHFIFSPLKLTIFTEAYDWSFRIFAQAPKFQIFGSESTLLRLANWFRNEAIKHNKHRDESRY